MKQGHVKNNIASETKVKKNTFDLSSPKNIHVTIILAKVRKHKFFHKGNTLGLIPPAQKLVLPYNTA